MVKNLKGRQPQGKNTFMEEEGEQILATDERMTEETEYGELEDTGMHLELPQNTLNVKDQIRVSWNFN